MTHDTKEIPQETIGLAMDMALAEAKLASNELEVPVGAILCRRSALQVGRVEVISKAHNRVEQRQDASAHAELLAIQDASKLLNAWRLTDSALVCTLEPCVMCLGAIRLARIPTIIFGAGDSRFGALGSVYQLGEADRTGPAPEVFSGIRAEESSNLLKEFFKARRVAEA